MATSLLVTFESYFFKVSTSSCSFSKAPINFSGLTGRVRHFITKSSSSSSSSSSESLGAIKGLFDELIPCYWRGTLMGGILDMGTMSGTSSSSSWSLWVTFGLKIV